MPWQLKDQKGHVLSLIYTLAWQVSTVASCDKRHSRRTSAPPPPAATKPDPRATSRVSQICITNVSFSGCLTLHNPFQHANPLKVMGRASTRPRDRPGTVSSRAAALLLLRLDGMALFHIFSGNICVRFALQSKRCELCFLLAYKI